ARARGVPALGDTAAAFSRGVRPAAHRSPRIGHTGRIRPIRGTGGTAFAHELRLVPGTEDATEGIMPPVIEPSVRSSRHTSNRGFLALEAQGLRNPRAPVRKRLQSLRLVGSAGPAAK